MLKFLLQRSETRIERRHRRFFAVLIWIIMYTILLFPWLGYNYILVLTFPALEIISMLFVFILNEKVLRFLLVRKQIVIYTILMLVIVICISFIIGNMQYFMISHYEEIASLKMHQMMIKNSVLMIYSIFVSTVITFALQNYDDREIKNNLIVEKREMEMKFLKMQINPHFLFNSLNNIYSMSITESKSTPECIMHLSNMLRYVLDNDSGYVNIEREVLHLQDFIEFNRLCSEKEPQVFFEYDLQDKNIRIPSMLLQPLLENCFKHGEEDQQIKVVLKASSGEINFFTENRIKDELSQNSTGIGLQNVHKRVELYYPDNNKLETSQESGLFRIHLFINTKVES